MIDAGAMRHQVTIEVRALLPQDAAGEPELVWQVFATRRAEIERMAGREVFTEGRSARVPTVFTLRYLDGVEPHMRLLCKGKVFNILSAIDPDGRRAELVIETQELVEETP